VAEDSDRAVRTARNESLFREVNERVKALNEAFDALSRNAEWICECGNTVCLEPIQTARPLLGRSEDGRRGRDCRGRRHRRRLASRDWFPRVSVWAGLDQSLELEAGALDHLLEVSDELHVDRVIGCMEGV
jgi:hypothetical protein